jgi:hypothetical protein
MSTRPLDIFSTYLDGGSNKNYDPTVPTVRRILLTFFAEVPEMSYKALWKKATEYGVTAAPFVVAMKELVVAGWLSVPEDALRTEDPTVKLTKTGAMAVETLVGAD